MPSTRLLGKRKLDVFEVAEGGWVFTEDRKGRKVKDWLGC